MYLALAVVFGLCAVGDFLSISTKAKVSSFFAVLILFLIGFLTGVIPHDIIDQAQLTGIGRIGSAFVIFNVGTSINFGEVKREWRIMIMSVIAMLVAVVSVLCVIPLIGREAALVSIPIVNGGIFATQIMTSAAMERGFAMAAALGTLVFAVQKFVGAIPASRCGISEARSLVRHYRESKENGIDLLKSENETESASDKPEKVLFCKKYDKYYTSFTILAIIAVFGLLGNWIGEITGISSAIWNLLLGMLAGQLGIVPSHALEKANAFGLFIVGIFCSIIPSLANIRIEEMLELGIQIFLVFAAVLVGSFLFLYVLPTWKFIGSRNLTIGIAMAQLLGFPATYMIVNEVAAAVGENEDEKNYIIKKLTPAFVVSGFVSVTTLSILFAGVFAKLL